MQGLTLTTVGAAEIEAAYAGGETVKITLVAFGNGGGSPVEVNPDATALAGKIGDVPFSSGGVGPSFIGGTAVIPCADYPGEVLREVGLISESGTLIAYGAYPDTYLPGQADTIVKEVVIKFIMPLTHAESVEIVIDPNIAVLTIEEADRRYLNESENLADLDDPAEARKNLGLGNAGNFAAVEQGGGVGMLGNKVHIGWGDNGQLLAQVDSTALGGLFTTEGGTLNGDLGVDGQGFIVKRGLQDIVNNERQTNGLRIQGVGELLVDIYHHERVGQHHFFGIHVAGGGVDGWYEFRNSGEFIAGSTVGAGGPNGATLHTDGNVNGSIWGGYLSNWLNDAIATAQKNAQDWAYQNLQQDTRFGALGSQQQDGSMQEVPYGCVVTGGNGNEGTQIGQVYYRPLQKLRNGVWVVVDRT